MRESILRQVQDALDAIGDAGPENAMALGVIAHLLSNKNLVPESLPKQELLGCACNDIEEILIAATMS